MSPLPPAPSAASAVCGIDVGGTGCRVIVADPSNPAPPRVHTGSGLRIGGDGLDVRKLMDTLDPLIAAACAASGVRHITTLALGAASIIALLRSTDTVHAELAARYGARTTIVASDVLTSHIGALSLGPGVVIAAGTGAIALGTDHRSLWKRVDGWGHLLGDAGSGAWIGARGLDAALRAADGRSGGSSALLDRLGSRFTSTDTLVRDVYTRQDRAAVLASFVPDVVELAGNGDAAADAILRSAGRELAATASAALIDGLPRRVRRVGGLFNASEALLAEFAAELGRLHPGVDLAPGAGSSLDGALQLASAAAPGSGQPDYPLFQSTGLHSTGFLSTGFLSTRHHEPAA